MGHKLTLDALAGLFNTETGQWVCICSEGDPQKIHWEDQHLPTICGLRPYLLGRDRPPMHHPKNEQPPLPTFSVEN